MSLDYSYIEVRRESAQSLGVQLDARRQVVLLAREQDDPDVQEFAAFDPRHHPYRRVAIPHGACRAAAASVAPWRAPPSLRPATRGAREAARVGRSRRRL